MSRAMPPPNSTALMRAMIPYALAGHRDGVPLFAPCRARIGAGDVAVVEGVHRAVDLLAGLVALARDQHDVAGLRQPERHRDGLATVADLHHPLAADPLGTQQHGPTDLGGVLAARVVVGDDEDVGQAGRDLAHDLALARVAVAAGAEHDDQLAARSAAQCLSAASTASGLCA